MIFNLIKNWRQKQEEMEELQSSIRMNQAKLQWKSILESHTQVLRINYSMRVLSKLSSANFSADEYKDPPEPNLNEFLEETNLTDEEKTLVKLEIG